jgi:succinate dehydrogenase/fumarate reductase iron-sulfur protein
MKFTLTKQAPGGQVEKFDVEYTHPEEGKRPTALDVLIWAQDNGHPDLAYRYGCRNEICGVCTIEVNGRPKLACKHKLRENNELSALSTLPVVRDYVVRRDLINKQLQGHLERTETDDIRAYSFDNVDDLHTLNTCIECYVCLDGCPLHEKNTEQDHQEALPHGNPYAFLKIQQAIIDPLATDQGKASARALADNLGLETCVGCPGCKCGVGINLMRDVINPLLEPEASSE